MSSSLSQHEASASLSVAAAMIGMASSPGKVSSGEESWSTPLASGATVKESSSVSEMTLGSVVSVQPRTYPGENKQGGVGRVLKIHPDGSLDVKYVLGGRETNVEAKWVTLKSFDGEKMVRKRTPPKSVNSKEPESRGRKALVCLDNKSASKTPGEKALSQGLGEKFSDVQSNIEEKRGQLPKIQISEAASSCPFKKGQTVKVASRTQPGMNKQGGVGRVAKVNADGTVNVKYILGGSEKNLELIHVEAIDTNAKHAREKKQRVIYEPPVELVRRRQLKRPAESAPPKASGSSRKKGPSGPKRAKNAASVQVKKVKLVKLKRAKSKDGKTKSSANDRSGFKKSPPAPQVKELNVQSTERDVVDLAKQKEFRVCVSKVFQNEDVQCLPSDELFTLINAMGDETFSSEEFHPRLVALDNDNRIMLQNVDDGSIRVWLV